MIIIDSQWAIEGANSLIVKPSKFKRIHSCERYDGMVVILPGDKLLMILKLAVI